MATDPRADIPSAFRQVLAADAVVTGEEDRRFAGSDIAFEGSSLAACIVSPRTPEEVAALVRVARAEGIALHPRGGGWSYTEAHLPQSSRSAIVDTAHLVGIGSEIDGTVEVGAGVTWSALYDALSAQGKRVPSFGPLSGLGAQVGSTLANDGAFFGGAGHGAIGQASVAAVTMIDGTGETRIVTEHDRHDPVLAPQPISGDCGAFGIKTAARLRVIDMPKATLFASFAFAEGRQMTEAMARLVDLPGLGELYAFNAGVHRNMIDSGFSTLEAISNDGSGNHGSHWAAGIVGLRTDRARRAELSEIPWALHVSIEGDPTAAMETRAELARRIASFGGEVIPDVIPRVTRAKPFRTIKALVTPRGERWLSSHGLVDAGEGAALLASLESIMAEAIVPHDAEGVRAGFLVSLIGPRITVEPQIYWPDSLSAVLRRMVTPEQLARFADAPSNLAGRERAYALRRTLISAMEAADAGHFQIGRTYIGNPGIPAAARERWCLMKRTFDPDRIMNPGVLGL